MLTHKAQILQQLFLSNTERFLFKELLGLRSITMEPTASILSFSQSKLTGSTLHGKNLLLNTRREKKASEQAFLSDLLGWNAIQNK